MILLHIIGGLVGLTSGAVALSASKGAKVHRKSGMIFVYAMSVLSISGAVTCIKNTRAKISLYFNRKNRRHPYNETGKVIRYLPEGQANGKVVITVQESCSS